VDAFDESYLNVAAEDTDLALRVIERGGRFVYAPRALVHHEVQLGSVGMLTRDQLRWVDVPSLFARHPWARKELLTASVFWKPEHAKALLFLVGCTLGRRRRALAALTWPWLHQRLCDGPVAETVGERIATLPAVLVLDLSETLVMLGGSVRHRTLVL